MPVTHDQDTQIQQLTRELEAERNSLNHPYKAKQYPDRLNNNIEDREQWERQKAMSSASLLISRKVEETKETVQRTEQTRRRVIREDELQKMPVYEHPEVRDQMSSYCVDVTYQPVSATSNGHAGHADNAELVSRTQTQHTTQQVTKVTKVIREVQHVAPDGTPVEYSPYGYGQTPAFPTTDHPDGRYYEQFPGEGGYGRWQRPPTPPSPSDRSESPPPQQAQPQEYGPSSSMVRGLPPFPQSGYEELDSTLLPSFRPPDPDGTQGDKYGYLDSSPYGYYPGSSSNGALYNGAAPRARFDEEEGLPRPSSVASDNRVRWRDPDLHEVIEFLSHPNNVVKANAAAYLQHLCYMDNPIKQKARSLGGIPPLVALLSHEIPEVHRNACGALRNVSYGRQNDENKRAIKNAGGIPPLVRLLRKTPDNEVRELVTGILWNLSSCEELKKPIIEDGLTVLVNHVMIPYSGWSRGGTVPHQEPPHPDLHWSTVFRNASGVLRNVSSAGEFARRKLRECDGLVECLLFTVRSAIGKSNIDNKSVENCVCVLRNLSYRCQEVEDPNYDKHYPGPGATSPSGPSRAGAAATKGENPGCFGASKKKKDGMASGQSKEQLSSSRGTLRSEPAKGMELLWQPEVVQGYLSLLSDCSNPETLEAAAGALQNLAACYWQPSIDVRAAVRKEKGLPILVELLRMEVDRVVCAVATALRNLAIDQRNKELIGKYAMRDLVQKLPSGNVQHDQGTSDETIAAVLATLNEVIKKNAEFARSLYEAGGVDRLVNMTRARNRYTPRVVKFASQVLYSMWQHQELRDVYRRGDWREADFVTKTVAARNARPNSPTHHNSTLNRPMASQGGTRYEDRTIPRGQPQYSRREEVAMSEMRSYADGQAVPGGVRIYPPGAIPGKAGEPVYAQVNRDKKKNRQLEEGGAWGYEDGEAKTDGGGDSWV